MENAEEILQCLDEYSKIKPKTIPRELEDYLLHVAKSGDPVYQWSNIKCLIRDKLINVITDFYESCPNVEIPPYPNVDPFNYENLKSFILEKFDSFTAAPFTVQRICELLTAPRKEYNRIDKYMRALEKNVLVVSTVEPGRKANTENGDNTINGLDLTQDIVHSEIDIEEMGETAVWPKATEITAQYPIAEPILVLEPQSTTDVQETFLTESSSVDTCPSTIDVVVKPTETEVSEEFTSTPEIQLPTISTPENTSDKIVELAQEQSIEKDGENTEQVVVAEKPVEEQDSNSETIGQVSETNRTNPVEESVPLDTVETADTQENVVLPTPEVENATLITANVEETKLESVTPENNVLVSNEAETPIPISSGDAPDALLSSEKIEEDFEENVAEAVENRETSEKIEEPPTVQTEEIKKDDETIETDTDIPKVEEATTKLSETVLSCPSMELEVAEAKDENEITGE